MKKIIWGITGSIAAYKCADIISALKKDGFDITCVMTECSKMFVTEETLAVLSENKVLSDMFHDGYNIVHTELAKADLLIIAPATANIIAKASCGLADDLLTTTILAAKCPIIFVPAMNETMYTNPITQKNISSLKELGAEFIDPEYGLLACGDYGVGRFPEKEKVIANIKNKF